MGEDVRRNKMTMEQLIGDVQLGSNFTFDEFAKVKTKLALLLVG